MAAGVCEHCGAQLVPRTLTLKGREYRMGWHPCQCQGAKDAEVAELERQRLADERRVADAWAARLGQAGIPSRYAAADVKDLPPANAYIHGPVGCGKTYAACARARADVRAGRRVRFSTMAEVAARVRSTYGRGSRDSEDDVVQALVSCDLLVLDDLGRERETEWSLALLWRVVDGRYGRMADTMVTSNYSRAELAARIASGGDEVMARAIVSRLAEMTVPIRMEGRDRRVRNGS